LDFLILQVWLFTYYLGIKLFLKGGKLLAKLVPLVLVGGTWVWTEFNWRGGQENLTYFSRNWKVFGKFKGWWKFYSFFKKERFGEEI